MVYKDHITQCSPLGVYFTIRSLGWISGTHPCAENIENAPAMIRGSSVAFSTDCWCQHTSTKEEGNLIGVGGWVSGGSKFRGAALSVARPKRTTWQPVDPHITISFLKGIKLWQEHLVREKVFILDLSSLPFDGSLPIWTHWDVIIINIILPHPRVANLLLISPFFKDIGISTETWSVWKKRIFVRPCCLNRR